MKLWSDRFKPHICFATARRNHIKTKWDRRGSVGENEVRGDRSATDQTTPFPKLKRISYGVPIVAKSGSDKHLSRLSVTRQGIKPLGYTLGNKNLNFVSDTFN